jgi:hypothetical protein
VHFGVGSRLRRNRRRIFEVLPTSELRPRPARSRSSRPDLAEAGQVRPPAGHAAPLVEACRSPIWPLHDAAIFLHWTMGKASRGRAAAVHQRGDLMPVDACGNSFGQRRRYSQPRELRAIHAEASSCRWLHAPASAPSSAPPPRQDRCRVSPGGNFAGSKSAGCLTGHDRAAPPRCRTTQLGGLRRSLPP